MLKDKKTVKMVSKRWKDDVEFGRQMLNGPHPIRIRRCTSLPKNLQVTNDCLLPLMENGKSLREEMKVCRSIARTITLLCRSIARTITFHVGSQGNRIGVASECPCFRLTVNTLIVQMFVIKGKNG